MAAGGGVTYPRVVKLLTEAVAAKGQRAVAREAGVALLSVQRYIKAESEPSLVSLRKLAVYFGKSVAWLRGETLDGEDGEIVQTAICGLCGSGLQAEAQEHGPLRVWPCNLCKHHSRE
jgi:transcriptional regulator with XRE-family HTH domain